VGVAPCTYLFRHFFVLVKSGKARDHLGAYYFQTRPDSAVSYISTLGGARWENWRADLVIVSAEANDHLVLPSNGPTLDRKGPSRRYRQSSCPCWTGSRPWRPVA
jgi:hypothetical protein